MLALAGENLARKLGVRGAALIAQLLDNEDDKVDETYSVWAAQLFYQIPGLSVLSETVANDVFKSIDSDDNAMIYFPLAIALLRDHRAPAEWGERAAEVLREGLDNGDVPSAWNREARALLAKRTKCEQQLTPAKRVR